MSIHRSRNIPLSVAILVASGDALIDVVGPYQVFTQASRQGGALFGEELGRYTVHVLGCGAGRSVRSRGGIGLLCTGTITSHADSIDTLIVAGSDVARDVPADPQLVDWIADRGAKARRVASVCSGAFLLAEAGLLDGKRATTHWRYANRFASRFPKVSVEPDPIYVRDGKVYTSAGMTAGMDLSLALVEEDFGRDAALGVPSMDASTADFARALELDLLSFEAHTALGDARMLGAMLDVITGGAQ